MLEDQQPIGRTVGNHKQREISLHASGELLREGAQFSTDLQRLGGGFRFPCGVYHYKTHEEAYRHHLEAVVEGVVANQEMRRGR